MVYKNLSLKQIEIIFDALNSHLFSGGYRVDDEGNKRSEDYQRDFHFLFGEAREFVYATYGVPD